MSDPIRDPDLDRLIRELNENSTGVLDDDERGPDFVPAGTVVTKEGTKGGKGGSRCAPPRRPWWRRGSRSTAISPR